MLLFARPIQTKMLITDIVWVGSIYLYSRPLSSDSISASMLSSKVTMSRAVKFRNMLSLGIGNKLEKISSKFLQMGLADSLALYLWHEIVKAVDLVVLRAVDGVVLQHVVRRHGVLPQLLVRPGPTRLNFFTIGT